MSTTNNDNEEHDVEAPLATEITVQASAQGYNSKKDSATSKIKVVKMWRKYICQNLSKEQKQKKNKNLKNGKNKNKNIRKEFCSLKECGDAREIKNLCIQSGDSNITHFIEENDFAIKLVEDILMLIGTVLPIIQDKKCTSKTKYVSRVILLWFKGRSSKSAARMLTENEFLSKMIQKLVDELNTPTSVQSFDFESGLNTARDVIDKFASFQKSTIYKKLYKIILYALTHSVFDKIGLDLDYLGYSMFQQEALRKKYHLGCDFIHTLFDTIIYLAQKGFQILKTRSFDCVFHSTKEYELFHVDVLSLKRQSLCLNNPEAHGFNEFDFRRNLDDLIEKGESIVKFNDKADTFEKKVLLSYLNDLMTIKADLCTKASARESRTPPYSILISGDSGIGKSTIKDILFTHFGKVNGLNVDSTYCYTRNPVAKFWDGFTTSQWAVILDDVAFMHPNKAPNGDPSVMEFLQIINAVPFTPDQADLSDKGRTPLRARLCIATTNTEDLNAHYYFSCASAAQRRFPFIVEPVVKPKFRKAGTMMLDSSKAEHDDGNYPDYWDWTIKKVEPVVLSSESKKANITIIHKNVSLRAFLTWFNGSIHDFNENQANVKESMDKLNNIVLCDECSLTPHLCECLKVQTLTVDLGNILTTILSFLFFGLMRLLLNSPRLCRLLYIIGFSEYISAGINNRIRASVMRRLGDRALVVMSYPAALATLCVSVGVISSLYKTYKIFDIQSNDSGVCPVGNDDTENVWYKSDFLLHPMDFSATTKSSKGLSLTKIQDLIFKSVIKIGVVVKPNSMRHGRAFCLKGQLYVTNNHIIPRIPEGEVRAVEIVIDDAANGVNQNQLVYIDESCIERYERGDYLVVRLPIVNRKGVLAYVPENDIELKHNGFYVSRSDKGALELNSVKRIKTGNVSQYTFEDVKYSYKEIEGIAEVQTYAGFCGTPLVAETGYGYSIVGIHVRGDDASTSTVISVPLNKRILQTLMTRFDLQFDEGAIMLSAPTAEKSLGALHKKSTLRYIQSGTASVIGSYVGFRPHHSSNVEKTPMSQVLQYVSPFGAPNLTGWEPWRKAAIELTNPLTHYKPAVVERSFKSFLSDIRARLPPEEYALLEVYNEFTAINGASRVKFVDKINRNTSAGLPWRKAKRTFMEAYDREMFGLPDAVKVDKEIMDRVGTMEDEYLAGRTVHPVTCGTLKDEPRKSGKCARLFNGAPMDFVILMRKYFLSSVRVIQRNQYVFEAAPGIVAQSTEWDTLYHHLLEHGAHRIIAGDYAAYDKQMIADFVLKAFQVLISICEDSGNFTKDDLTIMNGVSFDIAFPMIDLNGDLIRLWCSNPSGHPLTVIINCIVNSLYLRYVYFELNPDSEVETFRSNVNLMCYGDDNIMSVSEKIDWFNHTTIQRELLKIGIVYTMADKMVKSVPFIHISDATFLKRMWRFDSDIGYFLAPLDVESIEKQLTVWTRSKSISEEEQGIAIISAACNEWWFYGKCKFERERTILLHVVEELGWKDWVDESTFPTWNEIKVRFDSHSRIRV